MADFAVAFDGTRLNAADSETGWSGTDSAETDFYYQGATCIVNQIKTSRDEMYYTHGSTLDWTPSTGTRRILLTKMIVTNWGGIDGNGAEIHIGSSATATYEWRVFSSTTYPREGGWQIVAIDPNDAYGGDTRYTNGTPDLTAVDVFLFACDAAAQAKAPNFGIDAVDYIDHGTGLTGDGGGGASAEGSFQDFADADYGTDPTGATGGWGVVVEKAGIFYVNGVLTIGSATETDFTDSNSVVVFPDHRVFTGFCGIDIDLSNSSSVTAIANNIWNGRGAVYASPAACDTRPDHEVTGTAGTCTLDAITFNVFRNITFTSKVTATGCAFLNGLLITQGGGTITGCLFSGATTADDVAHVLSDDPSKISYGDFNFSDGHAIEVTASGVYGFAGNVFTGYGAEESTDAAILNDITPTTMGSYSETNQSTDYDVGNTKGQQAVAQSFTATAGDLSSARFYLKRVGAWTGDSYAELYASDGGSPPKPTGAALATSEVVALSTIGTSYEVVQYDFADAYTLSAATVYHIAFRSDAGGSTIYVDLGADNTAPGDAGFMSTETSGVWSSDATADACFYVYRDGHVVLNITDGGGTPTTKTTTAGAHVTVKNSQTIEIFGVTEGTRCLIQRDSDGANLLNALAYTSDGQGGFKASASFPYLSDTAVRVSAASSGKVVAGVADDTGVFTDETVNANDSGTADTMTLIPATSPATPDGFYYGHTEKWSQQDVDVLTAGAGTYTLAWEYYNGSGWSAVTGLSDGTDNYKNAGINRVSFTEPGSWATTTVTSQPGTTALYYLRARFVSGTVTTTPVGRTAQLDVTKYLRWEATGTIISTGLSAKATWLQDTIATF